MPNGKDVERSETAQAGLTVFESRLLNLLALMLVQERQQGVQIALLNRAGFRPTEIAAMLGTTPNTVSVELSARRRAKKKGKNTKKK